MKLVLGILILVSAVFLVVAVLMQSGSSKRLSGSIAGAAETFFGKNKGKTIDRLLGRLTNIVAIVFAVLVLASFLVSNRAEKQDTTTEDGDTEITETVTEAATEATTEAAADAATEATTEAAADATTEAEATTEADVTATEAATEAETEAETVADTTAAEQ